MLQIEIEVKLASQPSERGPLLPPLELAQARDESLRDALTSDAHRTSDDHAVTRVEFYVNDVLVGTDTAAPYAYSWRVPAQRGRTYRLQTRAYDAVPGHVGVSAYVTVMAR